MDAFKIYYAAAPAGVLRNTAAYFWEMLLHYPKFFVTQPIIQGFFSLSLYYNTGKGKNMFCSNSHQFLFKLDLHPCLMDLCLSREQQIHHRGSCSHLRRNN